MVSNPTAVAEEVQDTKFYIDAETVSEHELPQERIVNQMTKLNKVLPNHLAVRFQTKFKIAINPQRVVGRTHFHGPTITRGNVIPS